MPESTLQATPVHAVAFHADGHLPFPFLGLAGLETGTGAETITQPALLFAVAPLHLASGEALAAGASCALPQGLPAISAAAEPVAQVSGVVCTLACTVAAFEPFDTPRVLAPGIDLRLLAGQGFERESPVLAEVPCALGVLRLARMMRFEFRPEFPQRAVAVAAGSVQLEGQVYAAGAVVRLDHQKTLYIDALAASVLVLCAGQAWGDL